MRAWVSATVPPLWVYILSDCYALALITLIVMGYIGTRNILFEILQFKRFSRNDADDNG